MEYVTVVPSRDFSYQALDGRVPNIENFFYAPIVAVDTETTGVRITDAEILGHSAAYEQDSAFYFTSPRALKEVLENDAVPKIMYNGIFDRSVFKKAGVTINNIIDPMIAAHMVTESKLDLVHQVSHWVDGHPHVSSFKQDNPPFMMNLAELCEYSGPHSRYLLPLWKKLEARLIELKSHDVFTHIEMPLLPVLSDMEYIGTEVDSALLGKLGGVFHEKQEVLKEGLDYWGGHPGTNYDSPDQVAWLLFDKLKLKPTKKTSTGRWSTDAESLESLRGAHPFVNLLLSYRGYSKLIGTYVDGILSRMVDGRIHTSFNQAGTSTGRLSSSNPNLQNIPVRSAEGKLIRRAFVASRGKTLIKADADQLELKMMAHRSQDVLMLDAFRRGVDIHSLTAHEVFGIPMSELHKDSSYRFAGKTLNFTTVYMGGPGEVARQTGMPRSEAAKWLKKYFVVYSGVSRYFEETREALGAETWTPGVLKGEMLARTLFGRVKLIPELYSPKMSKLRERGYREAMSVQVQGSSSEVVKVGMIKLRNALEGTDVNMLLQVHDEVVLEAPTDLVPDVLDIMEETLPYYELDVPITYSYSVGPNWEELVGVKKEVLRGRAA